MATPSEKLAESLVVLQQLQAHNNIAIRSTELSRTHRERLLRNGFLQEVIKGWYIPARPNETTGESTTWYASYWQFCAAYLNYLKDNDWCLSPEQSLLLHAENWSVPKQLLVRATKARNNITTLPQNTSLLEIRSTLPAQYDVVVKNGLRMFSLPAALIACSPKLFIQNPTDLRAALSIVSDASEILNRLLSGGHSTIAGRLAAAFKNIKRDRIANDILDTMRIAGYQVHEKNPFETQHPIIHSIRERSPYANRIRLMWYEMRQQIIPRFPVIPNVPKTTQDYLKHIEDSYTIDAYHSLSIEGYRVSQDLIEKVRGGNWNPENIKNDQEQYHAMAARGYWQAFQVVQQSIEKVLNKANPGVISLESHSSWYREMFAPSVTAGILQASDLAGYRHAPVYIQQSKHIPPSWQAVPDVMPVLFELLTNETEPAVRIVLGHFIFVYIHPYIDGNGRIGRFLMNVMLASAGYPWTIIPVEQRANYMAALEYASVDQNIIPFTDFLAALVTAGMKTS